MSENSYKSLCAKDCGEFLINCANNHKKIMITAHRNPDGDAVGSALALKLIYEKLSGEAFCACCDSVPDYLTFMLKDKKDIKYTGEEYDIIIAVDTASPTQMGDLEYMAEKTSLSIDHHGSFTSFCDEYRDSTASAAGEMIFEIYDHLVKENKIKEDADICRLLYCAISADSGSFMYSNTTEKTHIIASKLVKIINSDEMGINTAEIARRLHNCKSLSSLKAQKLCIESLEFAEDGKIAYIIIEKEKAEKEGLKEEDLGSCIDIPRCVEGVRLSFVLKESSIKEEGRLFRISARSSCDVSVSEICKRFGGGGHAKAAGGSIIAKSGQEAKTAVLQEFIKALNGE